MLLYEGKDATLLVEIPFVPLEDGVHPQTSVAGQLYRCASVDSIRGNLRFRV